MCKTQSSHGGEVRYCTRHCVCPQDIYGFQVIILVSSQSVQRGKPMYNRTKKNPKVALSATTKVRS